MLRIKKFKNSILVGFLLATLLPLLFLGYFSYSYLSINMEEAELKSNGLLAENISSKFSASLKDTSKTLRQVQIFIDGYKEPGKIDDYLKKVVTSSAGLETIFVVSGKKRIVNIGSLSTSPPSQERFIGLGLTNSRIIRNIKPLRGPFWTQTFFSPFTGEKSLALIYPSSNNRLIIGIINLSFLRKLIDENFVQNRSIIVLDEAGKLIYRPDISFAEEPQSFANMEPFLQSRLGMFGTFQQKVRNTEYVISTSSIKETKWLVMSMLPYDMAKQPTRNMTKFFIFIVLFSLLIVVVLAFRQSNRLLAPLNYLGDNIRGVAEGDYQDVLPQQTHVEFEQVATHFRTMSSAIQRREQLLEINEERLISLLELHNAKWLDEKGLLKFALEQAVTLTKSSAGYIYFLKLGELRDNKVRWSSGFEDFCGKNGIEKTKLEGLELWSKSVDKRDFIIKNESNDELTGSSYPLSFKWLSAPIFDGDELVAIVGTMGKKENYDSTDARQLSLYFNHTWDIVLQKRSEKEKAKLAEQLAHVQKLEAIGTMAGGIAHDFNNVLMVILGNTEMARDNIERKEHLEQDLNEIYKASMRARDLVNQILSFSRNQTEGLKPFDILPVVKEAIKLFRSSLPANIKIKQSIGRESKLVVSDPSQIKQLVVNLCTNAYQAMEKMGTGVLEISAKPLSLKEDLVINDGNRINAGEYMCLQVKDSGVGIPESMVGRIFDPYYSTREKERGTGLGLSVVHGIVKGLKGVITVDSDEGKGAIFTVYLPAVESQESEVEHVLAADLPGGSEKILYIDDDESVASVNERILTNLGYNVTVFLSSLEAYDYFCENESSIDLVITDMAMPDMTGEALAEKILKKKVVPIILCTGYSEQMDTEKAKKQGISDLLMKPISRVNLALTVRKVCGFHPN